MTVTHPLYLWETVELDGPNNDGQKRRFAISGNQSVSKGAIAYLVDARTASFAALGTAPVAGLVSEEVLAVEARTSIPLITQGIFEAVASAAITAGDYVAMDSKTSNTVVSVPMNASGAISLAQLNNVIGRALETASADEQINVRLNL